jgi:hypothetical protein
VQIQSAFGCLGVWACHQERQAERTKTNENGQKIVLPFLFSYFFYGNGSGSRTTGSGNGSGINGNAKMDKYDRKIDGNERYTGT